MPIKGLTDRIVPRFPLLGRLRKGSQRTPEDIANNRPGRDLSYFRFTPEPGYEELATAFAKMYGERPQSLDILLPHKTVDDNWETGKELWGQGGLQHRCDGQMCSLWLGSDGQYHTDPVPCPGGCTEFGRLTLILPELIRAGYVGYVLFETHSIHDIISLESCMRELERKTNGSEYGLQGIAYRLYRVRGRISMPREDAKSGQVKRVSRECWLVRLSPSVEWAQRQLQIAIGPVIEIEPPNGEELEVATPEELHEPNQPPPPLPAQATPSPSLDEAPAASATRNNGKRWVDDPDALKSFWASTKRLGLTDGEVHKALGVESLKDYPGTTTEAWTAIHAYVKAK